MIEDISLIIERHTLMIVVRDIIGDTFLSIE